MVNIAGTDIPTPSIGIESSVIYFIIFVFLLVIVGAIGMFMIRHYKVYNKKIVVFENISGRGFQPVYKDRARVVRLGDGGEELLHLMKKKVYRTAYGKKMGINTYWFAIGQDGYWYNVVLGDVDAKMGMLDIEPIDRDMRYMHVAIRKNIQDRYKKINFMEKYGTMMMGGFFIVVLLIGGWFIVDKIAAISTEITGQMQATIKVTEATQQILSNLDNVCANSGLREAGG